MEAAKAVAELAQGAQETAERMDKAAAEAEKAAAAKIPEGTDPEAAKQQIEMAKSLAAMGAMGGGPAVNWRKLAPFLPTELGGYAAKGELDGSTRKVGGGMQVTTVKRRYTKGDASARVEITDAFSAPFLRAPFAMAAMVEEDSTKGYKKGKKIGGYTAIVDWTEASKQSGAVVLVAERFVVNVKVDKADKPDAAEGLVAALGLADLAKVKPEAGEGQGGDKDEAAATP